MDTTCFVLLLAFIATSRLFHSHFRHENEAHNITTEVDKVKFDGRHNRQWTAQLWRIRRENHGKDYSCIKFYKCNEKLY